MTDALTGLEIQSPLVVTMKLIFSMAAGFAIGFEREKHYQPAGLRTHMVLSLGACLVMIISILIPVEFPGSDPGRIAAQAISGIGFLGAGAIFRYGFSVKGLTTAASIWTTSAIGLAFGAGLYFAGLAGTALLIVVLQVFEVVETKLVERKDIRILTVEFKSETLEIGGVVKVLLDHGVTVRQTSIAELIESGTTELTINCRIDEDTSVKNIFHDIKAMGDIRVLRID